MVEKHLFFDFDGTLIDSAPSILASLKFAFDELGLEPVRPLTIDLIGPPLNLAVASLLGEALLEKLPSVVEIYKSHYDSIGCLQSLPYHGIPELLNRLQVSGFSIYLATNKRIEPTRKIVQHLGWSRFFKEVYALDAFASKFDDKASMLNHLAHLSGHAAGKPIYIGDRVEDGFAASVAGFGFMGVCWGYGGLEMSTSNFVRVHKPFEIARKLLNVSF